MCSITIEVDILAEVKARVGARDFSKLIQDLLVNWLEQFKKGSGKIEDMDKQELQAKVSQLAYQMQEYRKKITQMEKKEAEDRPIRVI